MRCSGTELPLVSLVCWLELKFCTVTYVLCDLYRLKEEGLSDSSAKTFKIKQIRNCVKGREASVIFRICFGNLRCTLKAKLAYPLQKLDKKRFTLS